MINAVINGYGRIGRGILRAYYENKKKFNNIKIIAINDIGNIQTIAYLTKYDSTYGIFKENVSFTENILKINDDEIKFFQERDLNKLNWKELDVDIVFECSGIFTDRNTAGIHIQKGAKKVLISSPPKKKSDVDNTIVFGVNDNTLKKTDLIISNSSCTTNCISVILNILLKKIDIINGIITTVHSYTNDQVLLDSYHNDFRRARSATQSIIPTKTGVASTLELILPSLKNKINGYALRVPTVNVSIVDIAFITNKEIEITRINDIIKNASKRKEYKNILTYNENDLVSIDYNHNPASANFDATLTKVSGKLIKISAWYDNEYGFCNRMLDLTNLLF